MCTVYERLINGLGLLGNVMDVNSGEWTGKMAGLGAGVGKGLQTQICHCQTRMVKV